MQKIEPGYYWAKLKTPSGGTLYGIPEHPGGLRIEPDMNEDGSCGWASTDWDIVEVWDNNAPDDPDEYVGVSVPGLPVTQWPNDFFWGPKVNDTPPAGADSPADHRASQAHNAFLRRLEVNRIAALLLDTWKRVDPNSGVAKHPASYVATFADMARAIVDDRAKLKAEQP